MAVFKVRLNVFKHWGHLSVYACEKLNFPSLTNIANIEFLSIQCGHESSALFSLCTRNTCWRKDRTTVVFDGTDFTLQIQTTCHGFIGEQGSSSRASRCATSGQEKRAVK